MKINTQRRITRRMFPILLASILAVFIIIFILAVSNDNSDNVNSPTITDSHVGNLSGKHADFIWVPHNGFMYLDTGNAELIHGLVPHGELLYYLYIEFSENHISQYQTNSPDTWEPYVATLIIKGVNEHGTTVDKVSAPAKTIHFNFIGLNINSLNEFTVITHEHSLEDGRDSLYYTRYDSTGNVLVREVLLPADTQWFPQNAFFDEYGVIAVYGFSHQGGSEVLIWDDNFTLLLEVPVHGGIGSFTSDGTFLYLAYAHGIVLREIDFYTGKHVSETPFPLYSTATSIHLARADSDFDLYVVTRQYLHGFILESGETEIILDFLESHINLSTHYYFVPLANGMVAVSQDKPNLTTHAWYTTLAILSPVHRSNFDNREYIRLAGFRLSNVFIEQVMDFNRRNTDYQITVHDYWESSDSTGFRQAVERLHFDILSGNMPDIILFDEPEDIALNRAREALIRQGLLLNLYTLIDADSILNREDFFPNILLGLEDDNGGLPVIGNQIMITTMVTANPVLQTENWNVSNFLALMEREIALGNTEPLGNRITGMRFLTTILENIGNYFVDSENATSNFDSESFIRLMNIAANIPTNLSYANWSIDFSPNYRALQGAEQVVDLVAFAGLSGWVIDEFYEEAPLDFSFVGLPGATGGIHNAQLWGTFSISANSHNQDGAWQFVREKLLPNATEQIALSVRINELEDRLAASPLDSSEMNVIREIVNGSTIQRPLSGTMLMIIEEGFSDFYRGLRTAEDAARIMQSRIMIYLSEQQ